jgi:hypothetical protein
MANPLDAVMQWYRTALDSLRVTQRTLNQGIAGAVPDKHVFFGQPLADCTSWLDSAKEELERFVVLALTAIFERTLLDYLTQIPQTALPPGDPHRDAVREEMIKDIEFWNISSRVLEVFPAVDANVRGQVKQIIDYRNWVAHGHTLAKPAPSNVIPAKAHQQLTDFLVQAGLLPP